MAKAKRELTAQELIMELPVACSAADDAQTPEEVIHMVRCELDLIEEGQDGTEDYTRQDISSIKKFLKRHSK